MEFEPMLTPREKSPLPENVPRGGSNPRHFGSEPKHYQLSYSGPARRPIHLLFCCAHPHQRASCLTARHVAVGGNPLQGDCMVSTEGGKRKLNLSDITMKVEETHSRGGRLSLCWGVTSNADLVYQ